MNIFYAICLSYSSQDNKNTKTYRVNDIIIKSIRWEISVILFDLLNRKVININLS